MEGLWLDNWEGWRESRRQDPKCKDLHEVAVKCGCARGGLSLSHHGHGSKPPFRHFPFLGQPIQTVPNANPTLYNM